jgi:hypothetical protein
MPSSMRLSGLKKRLSKNRKPEHTKGEVGFDTCLTFVLLWGINQPRGANMRTYHQYPNGTNRCPFCDSRNINGREWDAERNEAWQLVECDDCNEKWHDIYTFVGYEEVI